MEKILLIILHATIVDGDTIAAGGQSVRLWGIDAPEIQTGAGRQAARHMRQLVQGTELTCRIKDVDHYDRIVAQCFDPQGRDLACLMVESGNAQDWPRFSGGYYKTCNKGE